MELGDDRQLLLADRLDAGVGVGQLDPAQAVQDPHHLLLVDHHAVGLFQDLLHHRMLVLGRLAAVLDLDVVVDHAAFERPGAIEGVGGDDVAEVVGLHPLQEVADAAAFQLEHALGLAAAQQIVRRLIVEREGVGIDLLAGGLLDQPHDLGEDRQVAQAEEVHLQQPGLLDVGHRPLGDDFLLALHVLQGEVLDQRPIGDHHGRGVGADVAGQALDLLGQVQQLADLGVGVVDLLQVVALLDRLFERDVQLLGDQGDDGARPAGWTATWPGPRRGSRPGRPGCRRCRSGRRWPGRISP